MSMLQSNNYFSDTTRLNIGRSRIPMAHTHKTTFDAGKLIPIYYEEVLPGDTFKMHQNALVRMATPIYPVMDNAYLETFYFFVPLRLLWSHTKEFFGENTSGPWVPQTEYTIPQLKAPEGGWDAGSLADYFGIPTGIDFTVGTAAEETLDEDGVAPHGFTISALPFRGYSMIFNEWFRDQNTQSPVYVPLDDSIRQGERLSEAGLGISDNAYLGGKPLPVYKYHDYFTSGLPQPQKGPDVLIPMVDDIPVVTIDKGAQARFFDDDAPGVRISTSADMDDGYNYTPLVRGKGTSNSSLGVTKGNLTEYSLLDVQLTNLYADTTNAGGTINALRQAFQIQKFFEADARGGTRYREIIQGHFGVSSPDARMQVPEFLGGTKTMINVDPVVQTSDMGSTFRDLGSVGAYSVTNSIDDVFNKSFTEHGMVIGLACVRYDHSYQQGVDRRWTRKRRFDYFWPEFSNLGEQAILEREIYATAPDGVTSTYANDTAFAYQEAWAEYRYHPNRISGAFRSNYTGSLDVWHYGDYYETPPALSGGWTAETDANIERTLAVSTEPQFIADFYWQVDAIRPMPVYSIPGLADHH